MTYDERIAVCPPIVRAAIDAILHLEEQEIDPIGYDLAYYQEDLPMVVTAAIAPWKARIRRD